MEIIIDQAEIKYTCPYTVTDGTWTFQDTIELEYQPTTEELNKMMEDRFNTWKAYVETPLSSN